MDDKKINEALYASEYEKELESAAFETIFLLAERIRKLASIVESLELEILAGDMMDAAWPFISLEKIKKSLES